MDLNLVIMNLTGVYAIINLNNLNITLFQIIW